ncbi:hypothetical protein CEXT_708251 [Caerostris extrusa]|uniref:Uncharacterized protein n=1 Tax=Caerostris extrusa TaxID=172846 RepID=A0AAV4Q3R5_CAEEX|nr:hypothetical protein CEXT_708251 [Caerostris extrusa]
MLQSFNIKSDWIQTNDDEMFLYQPVFFLTHVFYALVCTNLAGENILIPNNKINTLPYLNGKYNVSVQEHGLYKRLPVKGLYCLRFCLCLLPFAHREVHTDLRAAAHQEEINSGYQ